MRRLVAEALLGGGELQHLGHAAQVLPLLVVERQRLARRVRGHDVARIWKGGPSLEQVTTEHDQ